jgi:hypothetical protein
VLVEETAMLRLSLVSVAGALTEALHKGDSDATRSVLGSFSCLMDMHGNEHVNI